MIEYQIVYYTPDPILGGQIPVILVYRDGRETRTMHIDRWYDGLSKTDGAIIMMIHESIGRVDLDAISPQVTVSPWRKVPPDAKAYEWLSRLVTGFWS